MANTGVQAIPGAMASMFANSNVKQTDAASSNAAGFGRLLNKNIQQKANTNQAPVRKTENQNLFQQSKDNGMKSAKASVLGKSAEASGSAGKLVSNVPNDSEVTVEEMLSSMSDELKAKLADLLDVTEDQLEEALETLGLSMMDLFQQNNLQNLFLEVKQVDDMSALLTDESLAADFQAVSDLVADQGEILEKLDLTPEEAKSLLEEFQNKLDQAAAPKQEEKQPVEDLEEDTISEEPIHAEVKTESKEETSSDSRGFTKDDKTEKHEMKEVHVTVNGNAQVTTETKVTFMDQLAPTSQAKEIVNQIVKEIKVTINHEQTSMEMVLTPEALGKVGLTVSTKDGVMTAHMITETNTAKQAIENQIVTLKETLNEQGLKVEAVEVTVAANNFNFMDESHTGQEKQENQSGVHKADRKLRMMDDDFDEDDVESQEAQAQSEILASVGKGMQINYSA